MNVFKKLVYVVTMANKNLKEKALMYKTAKLKKELIDLIQKVATDQVKVQAAYMPSGKVTDINRARLKSLAESNVQFMVNDALNEFDEKY